MKVFLSVMVVLLGLTMIGIEVSTNWRLATYTSEGVFLGLLALFLGFFALFSTELCSVNFKKGYFLKAIISGIIALLGMAYSGLYAGSFFCSFAENYSQTHKKASPLNNIREDEIKRLSNFHAVKIIIKDNSLQLSDDIANAQYQKTLCRKTNQKWSIYLSCLNEQDLFIARANNGLKNIVDLKAEKSNQERIALENQRRLDSLINEVRQAGKEVIYMPMFEAFGDTPESRLEFQRLAFKVFSLFIICVMNFGTFITSSKGGKKRDKKQTVLQSLEQRNEVSLANNWQGFESQQKKDVIKAIMDLPAGRNIAILGQSGFGKSSLLGRLAIEALNRNCKTYVLDLHFNITESSFDPRCSIIGKTVNSRAEIKEFFNWLKNELNKREVELKTIPHVFNTWETIVILMDEMFETINDCKLNNEFAVMYTKMRKYKIVFLGISQTFNVKSMGIEGNRDLLKSFDIFQMSGANKDYLIEHYEWNNEGKKALKETYRHPGTLKFSHIPESLPHDDIQITNAQESNPPVENTVENSSVPVAVTTDNVYQFPVNKGQSVAIKDASLPYKDASLLSKDTDAKGRTVSSPTLDALRLAIADGTFFNHEDIVGTRSLWRFSKVISPRQGISKDTAAKYVIQIKKDSLPLTREEWQRLNPNKSKKEVG